MNSKNFHYKDGSENNLNKIFNSPDYDKDKTWYNYLDTWNMYYHLSPERKNLLNWGIFKGNNNLNVLELGSGCGAITSALVEIDEISKITCVEGETSRYEASKIRHKHNHDKITFVNANIADFKPDELFDAVVVIGVLEYSGKYINHENPYLEFLNVVKKFLKPSGQLVLAIENQLGHKYLAGADEDHYQQPFIGISDYQHYDGIRTFTKDEMISKLKKAGLPFHKFYYPFPDYKMPKVVLSEDSFKNDDFDWLTLLDLPTNQHTKRPNYNFDEKAFLNLIKKNVDPGVFMNSFLIIASAEDLNKTESKMLAAKMNLTRHPNFCTIKKFNNSENGNIEVVEKHLSSGKITKSAYIKKTDNLSILLVDAIINEDVPKVEKYLSIWNKLLDENSITNFKESKSITDIWSSYTSKKYNSFYSDSKCFLGNDKIDLIPNNILVSDDNYFIIDMEWKLSCDYIPKELIIDRGMFWIINRVVRISGRSGSAVVNGKWNVSKLLQSIIPIYDYKSLDIFEKWFQSYSCIGEEAACKAIDGIIKTEKDPILITKKWCKSFLLTQLDWLRKSGKVVRLAEIIKN
jgi:2-polyprenyl-3-methyl-5-hydroxy-6-metoxy-1,4-benzoquinol methylase